MDCPNVSKWLWAVFFEVSVILGWIVYTQVIYPMCPLKAPVSSPPPEAIACYMANLAAYASGMYFFLNPVFRTIEGSFQILLAKVSHLTRS